MTFGLINACYSLPEWQAATFFAPCLLHAPPTLPPIQENNGPDKREFYFVNCLYAVSVFFV